MAKRVQLLPIHEFRNERTLLSTLSGATAIAALDEVGRGCLAGPVVTCASLWIDPLAPLWSSEESQEKLRAIDPHSVQRLWIPLIRDSKKLTPRARDICFDGAMQSFSELRPEQAPKLLEHAGAEPLSWSDCVAPSMPSIAFDTQGSLEQRAAALALSGRQEAPSEPHIQLKSPLVCFGFAIGAASAAEIDKINIWNAVQLAMGRSLRILAKKTSAQWDKAWAASILVVDGNHSIRVPKEFSAKRQVTAVGGDDAFASIGFSSVVAKVIRDRHMVELAKKFPQFGLDKHKGYATSEHKNAISEFGAAVVHRQSFLGKTLKADVE